MTVIEHKLLRGKRAHTVSEQDVWLARVLLLCDHAKRNHVLDELIEPAGSKVAKGSRWFDGQSMAAVVISVNDKFRLCLRVGYFGVTADVFSKAMGDLHNSSNMVRVAPFYAGYGKIVIPSKFESLRCAHFVLYTYII